MRAITSPCMPCPPGQTGGQKEPAAREARRKIFLPDVENFNSQSHYRVEGFDFPKIPKFVNTLYSSFAHKCLCNPPI